VRLGVALVRGPSMEPALHDGDCLLVLRPARVRPGAVVVGRLRGRPDLLVVKRAAVPVDGGWHLVSDNAGAPGAVSGPGEVEAVVLLRWWPLPPVRLRRVRPPAGTAWQH
jgi:signal peptidase I